MRVLIADDEPKVLSALTLLLDQEPDLELLGTVKNVDELDSKTREAEFDLILLDWELPGFTPGWLQRYHQEGERRALVVAMSGRTQTRQAAEDAGADAFVSKGDPPERLIDCLYELLRRWRYRD